MIIMPPPRDLPTRAVAVRKVADRRRGLTHSPSVSLFGGQGVDTLLDRDLHCQEAVRRDRERLQGNWRFLAGPREAQLTVQGDQFTMRFRNGDVYRGTCTLNPTHRPRAMDLHIDEGPEPFQGLTALAIYQFDSDHLIWC